MIAPLLHLNGSGAEALALGYERAGRALYAAVEALQAAAPHPRDYYPLGEGVFETARAEHEARVTALAAARDEICALHETVVCGIDARKAQRGWR